MLTSPWRAIKCRNILLAQEISQPQFPEGYESILEKDHHTVLLFYVFQEASAIGLCLTGGAALGGCIMEIRNTDLNEADETFTEHLVGKRFLSLCSQGQSINTEVKTLNKLVKYQH